MIILSWDMPSYPLVERDVFCFKIPIYNKCDLLNMYVGLFTFLFRFVGKNFPRVEILHQSTWINERIRDIWKILQIAFQEGGPAFLGC